MFTIDLVLGAMAAESTVYPDPFSGSYHFEILRRDAPEHVDWRKEHGGDRLLAAIQPHLAAYSLRQLARTKQEVKAIGAGGVEVLPAEEEEIADPLQEAFAQALNGLAARVESGELPADLLNAGGTSGLEEAMALVKSVKSNTAELSRDAVLKLLSQTVRVPAGNFGEGRPVGEVLVSWVIEKSEEQISAAQQFMEDAGKNLPEPSASN